MRLDGHRRFFNNIVDYRPWRLATQFFIVTLFVFRDEDEMIDYA